MQCAKRNVAFSGSGSLFVHSEQKTTVDWERKDWTTFGKCRCCHRACSQASHVWRETWQRLASLCCAHSHRRDSLCLWYQMKTVSLFLNTQISCKKKHRGRPRATPPATENECGPWESLQACSLLELACRHGNFTPMCSCMWRSDQEGTSPSITCTCGR